jgi:hypothetical protein
LTTPERAALRRFLCIWRAKAVAEPEDIAYIIAALHEERGWEIYKRLYANRSDSLSEPAERAA